MNDITIDWMHKQFVNANKSEYKIEQNLKALLKFLGYYVKVDTVNVFMKIIILKIMNHFHKIITIITNTSNLDLWTTDEFPSGIMLVDMVV